MPKVKVISENCGQCGTCVAMRPEVFEFDDEGRAKTIVDSIDDDLGFECPFGAIEVE